MQVNYGTVALVGTLTSKISEGGGRAKKAYISVAGDGVTIGTVTPVAHGFGVKNASPMMFDNTNTIYAVGTAAGTVSYWSERG